MRATLPSPYFCTSKPSPPPLDSCASSVHLVMMHTHPQIGSIHMLFFKKTEPTFGGAWSSVLSFASLALSCPR